MYLGGSWQQLSADCGIPVSRAGLSMIGSEGATNDDIVFELVSESQFDG